jgi:hypothetical protein
VQTVRQRPAVGRLDAAVGGVGGRIPYAAPDVLAIAPPPALGARSTKACIIAALRRAGRQRRLDDTATRIRDALRHPQLRQPPLVEQASGRQARAQIGTLNFECVNAAELIGPRGAPGAIQVRTIDTTHWSGHDIAQALERDTAQRGWTV